MPEQQYNYSVKGEFIRQVSSMREWISADGSTGYPAVAGRYHLYVSYACPWAHRTIIMRGLMGLESVVSMNVVHPVRVDDIWNFYDGYSDEVNNFTSAREAYMITDPDYQKRCTVPMLWDREEGRIINNESSEIIRMLNAEFGEFSDNPVDYYPEDRREEIDAINERIYHTLNNGVYRAGFAGSQEAYDEACTGVFETLDYLEEILSRQRYLAGEQITEADWRVFPTLVRFDSVYALHFKCNIHRLVDYPNLWGYTRELYQQPGVADTVHMDHIKLCYYKNHESVDPKGLIPLGPELDFMAPHGRG
jgi:putative glutathione S-transferase